MILDTQLFYLLNNLAGKSQSFDNVVVFLTSDLRYILAVLLIVFIFFHQYQNREKLQIFLVTTVSSSIAYFGITKLIRFFYHRPRPFTDLQVNQLLTNSNWSFPSGHATFFFAMATAVYLYNKKWGVFFFVGAILMTISRVIAGIHYPSDIIGGAIIGIATAYAVFYFARKIVERHTHQTS